MCKKRALALLPESDPALLFAMTSTWNVVIGRVQESTVNRHKILPLLREDIWA
jgi:hypothetical protein